MWSDQLVAEKTREPASRAVEGCGCERGGTYSNQKRCSKIILAALTVSADPFQPHSSVRPTGPTWAAVRGEATNPHLTRNPRATQLHTLVPSRKPWTEFVFSQTVVYSTPATVIGLTSTLARVWPARTPKERTRHWSALTDHQRA